MNTRKEMKKRAKRSVKKHYWIFVAACLIAALITQISNYFDLISSDVEYKERISVNTVGSYYSLRLSEVVDNAIQGNKEEALGIVEQIQQKKVADETDILGRSRGVLANIANNIESGSIFVVIISAINSISNSPNITLIILIVIGMILIGSFWFFVLNTYPVMLQRIFLEGVTYEKVGAERFLFLIRVKKWTKASWVMCVKSIYSFLWGITIIGGIIKRYSYAMVPCIVAENPDLSANEAITLSREMMNGYKLDYFVLELSFIGWNLLRDLTFGLGGIFFVDEYWNATRAEYYKEIRDSAKKNAVPSIYLCNDAYLFEKPTQEQLNKAYADVIQIMEKPVENMNDLKGFRGFLANWFGILLTASEKEIAYEKSQMEQIRIEGLVKAVQGKAYPSRLYSIAEKNKRAREEFIYYMRHYTIWSVILMFFIFSTIGWLWEVSLHLISDGVFVNRGVLQGPWLPIYGTGGVMILVLLNKFRKKPILEFILTIILCGCVEYFTSYYLEITHGGIRWWDYSGYLLNLHGRICAEGLFVFGIGGFGIVYFLAPLLDNQIQKLKLKVLIPICIILLTLFTVDQIYSKQHPNTGEGITDYAAVVSEETSQW